MRLNNKKGLTLTELMVTLAILCIISAPISLLFIQGYNSYYEESDIMAAQDKARSLMEEILKDLRQNDNKDIHVRTDHELGEDLRVLYIRDDLNYTWHTSSKNLLRSGLRVFQEDDGVQMIDFNIEEVKPEDRPSDQLDNYDSRVLMIRLTLKVGRRGEVTLENSYRRKVIG